jgi:hypothetical protein
MNKPVPPIAGIRTGIYRHYKGDEMQVVGTALHSETLEELVLYRHLTGEHAGEENYWVRPRAMFLEDVEVDGTKIPRFKFLRDDA